MSDVNDGAPRSGWYPDPEDANFLRKWNGRTWTDRRLPANRARRRSYQESHGEIAALAFLDRNPAATTAVSRTGAQAFAQANAERRADQRRAELDREIAGRLGELEREIDSRRKELDAELSARRAEFEQDLETRRSEFAAEMAGPRAAADAEVQRLPQEAR